MNKKDLPFFIFIYCALTLILVVLFAAGSTFKNFWPSFIGGMVLGCMNYILIFWFLLHQPRNFIIFTIILFFISPFVLMFIGEKFFGNQLLVIAYMFSLILTIINFEALGMNRRMVAALKATKARKDR